MKEYAKKKLWKGAKVKKDKVIKPIAKKDNVIKPIAIKRRLFAKQSTPQFPIVEMVPKKPKFVYKLQKFSDASNMIIYFGESVPDPILNYRNPWLMGINMKTCRNRCHSKAYHDEESRWLKKGSSLKDAQDKGRSFATVQVKRWEEFIANASK